MQYKINTVLIQFMYPYDMSYKNERIKKYFNFCLVYVVSIFLDGAVVQS